MTELLRDFLDPAEFYEACRKIAGVEFFCGVPDSLLKDFCAYVSTHTPKENHVIAANEGNAIGLAAGYHLATEKNSMVYLQNSGLGNIVNPLMSLCSTSVYSIPTLLLVGWRGEPGKRDEPQHRTQGQTTPGILASLGIPFSVLPDYQEGAEQVLTVANHHMKTAKGPYCLLVKRQTFLPFKMKKLEFRESLLNREQCLKEVVGSLNDRDVVVSTTGMLSRELFELRESRKQGHEKDFLTVGSMGHSSAIAMGISLFKPNRQVFCLDGDGSVIMHMGAMASVGQNAPKNFKHVIFNNGSHDSVGGQPSDALNESFSFRQIALGCGYKEVSEMQTIFCLKKLRMIYLKYFYKIKVFKYSCSLVFKTHFIHTLITERIIQFYEARVFLDQNSLLKLQNLVMGTGSWSTLGCRKMVNIAQPYFNRHFQKMLIKPLNPLA